MPDNYTAWKKSAIAEMRLQSKPLTGKSYLLLITLIGKHSRRGDLDNIAGSISETTI
jgi:hypothetical protein